MRLRVDRQAFGAALRGLPADQPVKLTVDRSGARLSWLRRVHGLEIYRTRCLNRVAVDFANQSWEGSCVLPVERLAAICKLCVQAEQIDIATDEEDPDRVNVVALGNPRLPIDARFGLTTQAEPRWSMDPGDRPAMFTARAWLLLEGLDRCEPCIDPGADMSPVWEKGAKEARPCSRFYLAGLLVEAEGDDGRVIGTDGCQLAQVAFPACPLEDSGPLRQAIVPWRAIKDVRSFLRGLEADAWVVLRFYEKHLAVCCGDDWLVINQPEVWRFPRTRDIWPEERCKASARIDVKSFAKAVKATARFVEKDGGPAVRVRIDGDGHITVPRGDGEAARSGFKVASRYADPTAIEFPITHRLLEGLARVAGKDREAIVQFFGHDRAVSVSFDGSGRFLMMPCEEDPKMARNRKQRARNRDRQARPAAGATAEAIASQPSNEPESPPVPAVAVAPETEPVEAPAANDLPPEREPCINCGTTRGGLTTNRKYERTKGRCQSCYNHYRRTGQDKPIVTTKGAVA